MIPAISRRYLFASVPMPTSRRMSFGLYGQRGNQLWSLVSYRSSRFRGLRSISKRHSGPQNARLWNARRAQLPTPRSTISLNSSVITPIEQAALNSRYDGSISCSSVASRLTTSSRTGRLQTISKSHFPTFSETSLMLFLFPTTRAVTESTILRLISRQMPSLLTSVRSLVTRLLFPSF